MLPFIPAAIASGLALFLASNANFTVPRTSTTALLGQYNSEFTRDIIQFHAHILYTLPSRALGEAERGLHISHYATALSEKVRQSDLSFHTVADGISSVVDDLTPIVRSTVSKALNSSFFCTASLYFGSLTSRLPGLYVYTISNGSHFNETTLPKSEPRPSDSVTSRVFPTPSGVHETTLAKHEHEHEHHKQGSDPSHRSLTKDHSAVDCSNTVLALDRRMVRPPQPHGCEAHCYVRCTMPIG